MPWYTDSSGARSFQILRQEEEMDCGLACLAMCLNQVWGDTPSISSIKGMMGPARAMAPTSIESAAIKGYSASTQDRVGMTQTLQQGSPLQSVTQGKGTSMEPLAKYAARYRLDMIYGEEGRAALVMNVKRGRPMILRVKWSKGPGSHWVVVPYACDGGFFVLDPFYGLHFNDSATQYKAPGPDGEVFGSWHDDWLMAAGPLTQETAPTKKVALPGMTVPDLPPPPLPPRDDLPPLVLPSTGPLPLPPPPIGTPHPLHAPD